MPMKLMQMSDRATRRKGFLLSLFPVLTLVLGIVLAPRITPGLYAVMVMVTLGISCQSLGWLILQTSQQLSLSHAETAERQTAAQSTAETAELARYLEELQANTLKIVAEGAKLQASADDAGHAAQAIVQAIEAAGTAAEHSGATCDRMFSAIEQQARSSMEAADSTKQLQDVVAWAYVSSQQQQSAVKQADQEMNQAAVKVAMVAQSAEKLAAMAAQSAAAAQQGRQAVVATVESIARMRHQVTVSAEKTRDLGERGDQIGLIIETITQIAEQTNLLALNAAIEAARAGEHGRSFAVVASEVRKLAERAALATQDISLLIQNIQIGVKSAVVAMEASHAEVTIGTRQSEEAGNALALILNSTLSVQSEVQQVASTTKALYTTVEQVQTRVAAVRQAATENEQAMTEMVSISAKTASSIAAVALANEQAAMEAEEVGNAAANMSEAALTIAAHSKDLAASLEQINKTVDEINRCEQVSACPVRNMLRLCA